jgi:hypothetical protein
VYGVTDQTPPPPLGTTESQAPRAAEGIILTPQVACWTLTGSNGRNPAASATRRYLPATAVSAAIPTWNHPRACEDFIICGGPEADPPVEWPRAAEGGAFTQTRSEWDRAGGTGAVVHDLVRGRAYLDEVLDGESNGSSGLGRSPASTVRPVPQMQLARPAISKRLLNLVHHSWAAEGLRYITPRSCIMASFG